MGEEIIIVLTNKIIEQGKSYIGGWSSLQLKVLGIKGFPKGWKGKIIGKKYPESVIKKFLYLKDKHLL